MSERWNESEAHSGADDTYYIENDHMGESGFQWAVTKLLAELLAFFFERQERTMLVAGNQYIHFRDGGRSDCIAPDIYVIADDSTPVEQVGSWRVWERGGKVPALALEVVSDSATEARKDYEPEQLAKYEKLGVQELFRYDAYAGHPPRRILGQARQRWTHWVRSAEGRLLEVPPEHPQRVRSALFDFWLVHMEPRGVRLGIGPQGLGLWPTRWEDAQRRAEEESRRAEEESRRAEEESRRAEEESRRAEEESRRAEEESRRAEEESRRAEEESRRAAATEQRLEEALAEISRLRAASGQDG